MSVAIPMKGNRGVLVGIYKITSPSGKVYIGQSWDILERWRQYKSSYPLRSQPKLANSLRKYGGLNHKFEIVEWFSAGCNQTTLDEHERNLITEARSNGLSLLNIREGGQGGKQAPESVAKMVATRRANGSYYVTEEQCKRRSESQKGKPGRKHSEEVKRLLSEQRKGLSLSPETREKIRRANLGRKHSAETKAKIATSKTGKKRPDIPARWALKRGPRHYKQGTLFALVKRKAHPVHIGNKWSTGRVQGPEERKLRSETTKRFWAKRKALGISGALGS